MLLYLLRKGALFFITLLVLTLISFSILHIHANSTGGESAFFSDWLAYLVKLSRGDLGVAHDGATVFSHLVSVFPATIELCLFAFLLAMLIGIPIGILTGVIRGSYLDNLIYALITLISAIPIFGVSIVCIMLFSVYFGELPTSGRYNPLLEIPAITGFSLVDIFLAKMPAKEIALYDIIRHLMLPALILSIAPTTELIKLLRETVAEVMTQNYIKASATKGLSKLDIIRHHVLKNALPPVFFKFALQISSMISLIIIIESVFHWPGVGSWLLHSLAVQDYASVQAGVLVIGAMVLVITLFFELLSVSMSPLMRREWYAVNP